MLDEAGHGQQHGRLAEAVMVGVAAGGAVFRSGHAVVVPQALSSGEAKLGGKPGAARRVKAGGRHARGRLEGSPC